MIHPKNTPEQNPVPSGNPLVSTSLVGPGVVEFVVDSALVLTISSLPVSPPHFHLLDESMMRNLDFVVFDEVCLVLLCL